MKGRWCMLVLLGVAVTAAPVTAQVPYERILDAASEPEHWLTYSGSYGAQRYSTLDQISRANVDQLQPAWVYQTRSTQKFEVSPLVVDGVMYITEPPSDATALDLRTGRPIWSYRRSLPAGIERWTPEFGQLAKVGSRPRRRSLECHGSDGVILLS